VGITPLLAFRVFCNVTADIVAPYPERPTDGFISIVVNVSAIAGTSFEVRSSFGVCVSFL
jgi:exosome complex RNA-binding protein Rrp42 (RNase PH superfamily)